MSQTLHVHEQLRAMILSVELGPGERLTERWLENRFEASRTPIRAALARLEAEDLVQRDGRQWIVAPINIGELQHLSELRKTLETGIVVLACHRSSKADVEALEDLLRTCQTDTPREQWHRVGTEFHVALARSTGNPFFVKAIEGIMTRLSRVRWLEVWAEPSREQAWAEHRRVLAMVKRKRHSEAADQIGIHITNTFDRLLRSLREDQRGLRARGCAIIDGP